MTTGFGEDGTYQAAVIRGSGWRPWRMVCTCGVARRRRWSVGSALVDLAAHVSSTPCGLADEPVVR